MIELENRACETYAELISEFAGNSSKVGAAFKELVALGIMDGDDVLWWELENVAEPTDGRGEFLVEHAQLWPVLRQMAESRGHLQLGDSERAGIDALIRAEDIVLWHTHVNTVEPSAEDVAEFPAWLAVCGMVYHVPTGTSTLYNSAGVISNSHVPDSALATPREV